MFIGKCLSVKLLYKWLNIETNINVHLSGMSYIIHAQIHNFNNDK